MHLRYVINLKNLIANWQKDVKLMYNFDDFSGKTSPVIKHHKYFDSYEIRLVYFFSKISTNLKFVAMKYIYRQLILMTSNLYFTLIDYLRRTYENCGKCSAHHAGAKFCMDLQRSKWTYEIDVQVILSSVFISIQPV